MDTRIKTDLTAEVIALDDVKNFIKFDEDSDEEVQLIQDMITAVRAHFEKRTGLSFGEKTYETLFHYYDRPFLLPVAPVISIESVEVVDYEGTKTALTLNSGYYKRGMLEVGILATISESETLLVTYTAGYGDDATQKLPADLKNAMKMQVKQWYDNRDDFLEFNILGSIDRVLQLHKMKLI